jgi:hypothetical protein
MRNWTLRLLPASFWLLTRPTLHPEGKACMLLRNVDEVPPDYTAPHPSRRYHNTSVRKSDLKRNIMLEGMKRCGTCCITCSWRHGCWRDYRIIILFLFQVVSIRFQAAHKQVLIGSRRDCANQCGSLIQRHIIRLLNLKSLRNSLYLSQSRSYKTGFITSCKLKPRFIFSSPLLH